MCGYSWTTAPKYEYCKKYCHEIDKIEGEMESDHCLQKWLYYYKVGFTRSAQRLTFTLKG
jgi:hypothetical protein